MFSNERRRGRGRGRVSVRSDSSKDKKGRRDGMGEERRARKGRGRGMGGRKKKKKREREREHSPSTHPHSYKQWKPSSPRPSYQHSWHRHRFLQGSCNNHKPKQETGRSAGGSREIGFRKVEGVSSFLGRDELGKRNVRASQSARAGASSGLPTITHDEGRVSRGL